MTAQQTLGSLFMAIVTAIVTALVTAWLSNRYERHRLRQTWRRETNERIERICLCQVGASAMARSRQGRFEGHIHVETSWLAGKP